MGNINQKSLEYNCRIQIRLDIVLQTKSVRFRLTTSSRQGNFNFL